MPSISKLLRLATLPETRSLIGRATNSGSIRDVAYRARTDRVGLARDLADPAHVWRRARVAIAHPATHELARVGLVFLPGPYGRIAWAAGWLVGSPRPGSTIDLGRRRGSHASAVVRWGCSRIVTVLLGTSAV